MAKREKVLRKDQAVILGASALITGFLLGLISYHLILGGSTIPSSQQQASFSQQQAPPAAVSPPTTTLQDYSTEIFELKKILAARPDNGKSWIRLGNLYFDSNQPLEAIDAYTKGLELTGNDPNVLTDRGIMYRAIKDFVPAIADFRKAADLDKTHINSLYNLGITLLHDLQDNIGALEAWEELLATRTLQPEAKAQLEERIGALKKMAEAQQAAQ